MSLSEKVTALLVVKGRESYTPRWLAFHQRAGLDGPVLVGDGAPSDENEGKIAQFRESTGFDVTYLRYDDQSYGAYYEKLRDLVARAKTPYVHLSSNDDFIFPSALCNSVAFLEAHKDYVTCGGGVAGILMTDRTLNCAIGMAYGEDCVGLRQIYPSFFVENRGSAERVFHCMESYVPTYYAVHRREALLEAFDELVKAKIEDPLIAEFFVCLYLAALGRQKQVFDQIGYLRQLNSSQLNASLPGFFENVVRGTLSRDLQRLAKVLSDRCAVRDGMDSEAIRETLNQYFVTYYRRAVLPKTGYQAKQLAAKRFIGSCLHTARAKLKPVHCAAKMLERWKIRRALRANGGDQDAIHASNAELKLALDISCGS